MSTPILAIVITYHPNEFCIQNILTYYDDVTEIILVDNTEHDNTDFIESVQKYNKISIIKQNINLGIGKALNLAMEVAIKKNYSFILTMDQDSSFADLEFKKYMNCLKAIHEPNLGMLGINYENKDIDKNEICSFFETTSLITSGSILTLAAYQKIGGFNESLFIDGVDHDFCLRLLEQNYKVLSLPGVYLTHNLGTKKEVRNWGIGKNVTRHIHSAIRIYYITRNYLYLNHKYKNRFPEFCGKLKKEIFQKLKNGLLYEKGKWGYIKYFYKGIVDYKSGRFGQLNRTGK